ncbi:hypothetical protein ACYSNM_08295 [Myroides sp. LJL116]
MNVLIRILASFFLYPWLPMLWKGSIIRNTKYKSGVPLLSNYNKMNTLFGIWGIIMVMIVFTFLDKIGSSQEGLLIPVLILVVSGVALTYFNVRAALKKL